MFLCNNSKLEIAKISFKNWMSKLPITWQLKRNAMPRAMETNLPTASISQESALEITAQPHSHAVREMTRKHGRTTDLRLSGVHKLGTGRNPKKTRILWPQFPQNHSNMRETCDGGTLYPDWLNATALAVIGEGVTSGETGISDSSYTLPVNLHSCPKPD